MTEGLVGPIDADPVEAANFRRYQYYTRYAIIVPGRLAWIILRSMFVSGPFFGVPKK